MENNNNGLPEYHVGNGPEAAHARVDAGNAERNGYAYGTQDSGNSNGYAYGQQTQNEGNYQQAQNNQQTGGYQQTGQNQQFQQGASSGANTVPPYYQTNNQYGNDDSVFSVGQWIVTLIIGMIPCIGIILYIVWGFSSNGNQNRKNFCRAQLLIIAVLFVLYILFAVILGFSAFSASRSIYF